MASSNDQQPLLTATSTDTTSVMATVGTVGETTSGAKQMETVSTIAATAITTAPAVQEEDKGNNDNINEDTKLHHALVKDNDFVKRMLWHNDDSSDSDSDDEDEFTNVQSKRKKEKRTAFVCVLCMCIFIAIIVTGSWLAADVSYATGPQIAGYALLTVAGIVLFFLFLMCCGVCLSG
jgi:hypothetical protein